MGEARTAGPFERAKSAPFAAAEDCAARHYALLDIANSRKSAEAAHIYPTYLCGATRFMLHHSATLTEARPPSVRQ